MHWIGIDDGLEYPLESFAELNCFLWGHFDGFVDQEEESVIDDDAGLSRLLRYNPHRADLQVANELLVLFQKLLREDEPEALFDEVEQFFAEEVGVLVGRFVWAAFECFLAPFLAPGWS
jgi:hypothetical protein